MFRLTPRLVRIVGLLSSHIQRVSEDSVPTGHLQHGYTVKVLLAACKATATAKRIHAQVLLRIYGINFDIGQC